MVKLATTVNAFRELGGTSVIRRILLLPKVAHFIYYTVTRLISKKYSAISVREHLF